MNILFHKWIRQWFQHRTHCKQLMTLTDSERNDLAISRIDAEQLAGRYPSSECYELHRGEQSYVKRDKTGRIV